MVIISQMNFILGFSGSGFSANYLLENWQNEWTIIRTITDYFSLYQLIDQVTQCLTQVLLIFCKFMHLHMSFHFNYKPNYWTNQSFDLMTNVTALHPEESVYFFIFIFHNNPIVFPRMKNINLIVEQKKKVRKAAKSLGYNVWGTMNVCTECHSSSSRMMIFQSADSCLYNG